MRWRPPVISTLLLTTAPSPRTVQVDLGTPEIRWPRSTARSHRISGKQGIGTNLDGPLGQRGRPRILHSFLMWIFASHYADLSSRHCLALSCAWHCSGLPAWEPACGDYVGTSKPLGRTTATRCHMPCATPCSERVPGGLISARSPPAPLGPISSWPIGLGRTVSAYKTARRVSRFGLPADADPTRALFAGYYGPPYC